MFLGLTITSSWGNGHATTYRSLLRDLHQRGHEVLFLERNVPWYAANRDLGSPPYCKVALYKSIAELKRKYADAVRGADVVVVGSYVPEGVVVGEWVTRIASGVTAFYDIDTPVTLAKLARKDYEYLSHELIPRFDIYLSFTGGPTLDLLEKKYGSPAARALYCSADVQSYFPEPAEDPAWDLGYMGTYSDDRQPGLEELMLSCARRWRAGRFAVAGPKYPESIRWPRNVKRIEHLPPGRHRAFYNNQRYTLNITRADMCDAGYCPSVRLFEAAACGTPIISDRWDGLEEFFQIGNEILISRHSYETARYLLDIPEEDRMAIGERARNRILKCHTSAHRARELESFVLQVMHQASTWPTAELA